MRRIAVVPVSARLKAGILGAATVWGRGSVVAVLLTLSLVLLGEGAPGDLDPTFGVGGKVTTDFGGLGDLAVALVLQPDDKLVAAGLSDASGARDFALARYLPDGSPDATFGVGGKVTTDFGGVEDVASALVRLPDGKLVAAGHSNVNGPLQFALARYLSDGSLDVTFGVGGKVTTDFGEIGQAFALILQPDGKLVAAGRSVINDDDNNFALARYLSDGNLDPTFGVGGKVTIDFGEGEQAFALVLQPDGKLVAAGISFNGSGDFALARYLSDGSPDATFGVGGKVTTDFGGDDQATSLILQPDGKLVAAGFSIINDFDFVLARYLPDGSLDATFGVGGKVTTDFGGQDIANALVRQPDGKLVAGGSKNVVDGAGDFALARYLPDGSLDATFGVGGKVTTDFGSQPDGVVALVLQPDGKLVAAGGSIDTSSDSDFALARYEGDESPIVLEVAIDIKPGSSSNTINPKSKGVIPVAILTTNTFDATTVDPLSVEFGPNGATEAHGTGHIEDVNQDGEPDLLLHFKTQATGIECGDTSAALTGKTVDGEPIQGSDAIQTVGCNKYASVPSGS